MSSVIVAGDTSGSVTLQAPAVSGSTVLTLPTTSGTLVVNSGAQTIEFADGSASAPSITNSGDTNTGMFFPAADTIAFAEGGTEAMRIDSSGNLLVGTTSPLQSSQLTVYASPTPITTIDRTTNIGATVSCASSGTGYIQGGVRLGTEGNSGIYGYDDGTSGAQGIGIFTGNNTTIAERMRIPSTGGIQSVNCVSVGNATPSTSGAGITFPATQSASTDANTLDDYEEGTWTPTIAGSTVVGTGTYTTQAGTYTKVGRLVTVTVSVVWTAHTGTGHIRIPNLPFTSANITSIEHLCVPEFANMTMPASTTPCAIIGANSTVTTIYSQAVGTGTVAVLAMDTAAGIWLSITYQAT
jgi:hypothetical protein